MSKLKLTTAKDFRKKTKEVKFDGILIKLPSESVVRLRQPSISDMLKNGELPDHLISIALEQAQGSSVGKLTPERLKKSIEMIDYILINSFVEPKLVDKNPKDDEICLSDLVDEDRDFVYQFVQGGSAQLKNFRSKQ